MMTSTSKGSRFTERQTRVIGALVDARTSGAWLTREAIDRIAGASNGPDIIRKIRHIVGYDGVLMQLREVKDLDGKSIKAGRYRMTDDGYQRLKATGFEAESASVKVVVALSFKVFKRLDAPCLVG